MDFGKLSQNQQITVGAAAAMLLISFLPWFGVRGLISISGWSSGFTGVVGFLLVVAAGVILVMEAMDRATVSSPAQLVLYLATGGFALLILRLIFTWGAPRRFGLVLAVIAGGVAAWGGYRNWLDNS